MKSTKESQVETTLKLLIALLAEPRATAVTLAKAIGRKESWVNVMMMRFRSAGLDIEYDRPKGRYIVNVGPDLKRKLSAFASDVKKAVEDVETQAPSVRFISSLERYSVKQFADYLGGTPSNVYNMINGYKGAKLPAGWCAYQLAGQGKWWIQKMGVGRDGKPEVPEHALNAKSLIVGEGEQVEAKDLIKASTCVVAGCTNPVMSRGFCNGHYYQALRHPDRFPKPTDGRPWPPSKKAKKKKAR